MSVRHGLLAVLDRGPCYGYQLKREFETRTGGSWPLNVAQVYSTLDRLERDGLISALDAEGVEQRRFAITDEGRAEVRRWFDDPIVERPGATRNELPVKLALALTLPGVDVERIIGAQRRATVSQLQELNRVKRSAAAPADREALGWELVVDSLIFAAEAQVRWLDQVEAKMGRLAREGVPVAFDLETDLPGRGRPRVLTTKRATK
ncbi:PadR family transcriptional regulator [Microbacterium lacticum]